MISLESEKQDLEFNSLYDGQLVKWSQHRSCMTKFSTKVDVCFFAFLRRRHFYHWL